MTSHNVDELLHTQQQVEPVQEPVQKQEFSEDSEGSKASIEERSQEEKLNYLEQFRKDKEESLNPKETVTESEPEAATETVTSESTPTVEATEEVAESTSDTDEYGTPVQKKESRMFTEEEVQNMIRDRLSRVKTEANNYQENVGINTQQQVQQAANNFEADPDSSESWETQLSNFIRNEVGRMSQEQQQQHYRAELQRKQQEFESNFTNGMSRYQDFHNVVGNKPFTNDIMQATMSMKDPAAFCYAAAKMHPGEIDRISKLTNPYEIATEVGRLEERMKRSKNVSSAPRPATKITSDVASKYNDKPSLDSLINADARRKLSRQ